MKDAGRNAGPTFGRDKFGGRARFGLLCYTDTLNLGDEIQSIAARRFLPSIDHYINREMLSGFSPPDGAPVGLVMNGWFCHHPENWPPSDAVVPLLVGLHITQERSSRGGRSAKDAMLGHPAVKYLRGFGPVGARDLGTLAMLRASGVDSYFSGCLSLTLSRPPVERDENLVVMNEVPPAVARHIRATSGKRVIGTNHACPWNDMVKRFEAAETLLAVYAGAGCVVTSRLHCALPCVAMGTPVFLLDVQRDRYRFAGLEDFFHHGTAADFIAGAANYDVDRPPPNPQTHLPYRAALTARMERFVSALQDDAAPAAPPLSAAERSQILSINHSELTRALIRQNQRIASLEQRLAALAKRIEAAPATQSAA